MRCLAALLCCLPAAPALELTPLAGEPRPGAPIAVHLTDLPPALPTTLHWRVVSEDAGALFEETAPATTVRSRWALLPPAELATGVRLREPAAEHEFLLTQRPPTGVLAIIAGDDPTAFPAASLLPETLFDTREVQPLRTAIGRVAADAVPSLPAWWCAADAAVLTPGALARFDDEQCRGLERWLRAGGGALLVWDDQASAAAQAFIARLRRGAALADLPTSHRVGAGTALILAAAELDTDAATWRQRTAAVWRVEARWREQVATALLAPEEAMPLRYEREHNQLVPSYSSYASDYERMFTQVLRKEQQPPPWWFVLLPLAVLALWLCPGEWLLIGRTRWRRWSLVMMPLACLAATLATYLLVRSWLGERPRDRVIEVRDLDADGAVFRTLRFGALLRPDAATVTIPLGSGIGSGGAWIGTPGRDLHLRQEVPPWSPQSWRSLAFGGVAEAPWASLPTGSGEVGFHRWLAGLAASHGGAAGRAGDGLWRRHGAALPDWCGRAIDALPQLGAGARWTSAWNRRNSNSAAPQRAVAPHGGPSWDDVGLGDDSDDRERVQVVAWCVDNRLIIERRLVILPTTTPP